jgi:tRNA pseudouridine55 synthase
MGVKHIGIFGKRNVGKSSLINLLLGQEVAIVSDTPGTTTDPVKKRMEIPDIGPVQLIDTAGFDDGGEVGVKRVEKTMKVIEEIDMVNKEVTFEVTCSKGTYIRTICSDLGEALGCGAVMSALTRTASGVFRAEDGVDPEALKTMTEEDIEKYVLDVDYPLVHFGKVEMSEDRAKYFRMGNSIWPSQVNIAETPDPDVTGLVNARGRDYSLIYKVYEEETGEFLGTGFLDQKEGRLKADKVFAAREQQR